MTAVFPGFAPARYFFEWGLPALYFFLFVRGIDREFLSNLFPLMDRFNLIVYDGGLCLSWFFTGGVPALPALEKTGPVVSGCAGLGMLALVFVLVFVSGRKTGLDYELRLAQEIINSGANYYKRLDGILREIKILRHDYKYQIGVIEELADISRAKYIREFLAGIKSRYLRTEPAIFCENLIISAILANYAERFAKHNIPFHVQAVLPAEFPSSGKTASPPDSYEICMVLGNLLENSFEGTMTAPMTERRVSLFIRINGGNLLIEAKNTFDGKLVFNKRGSGPGKLPQSRKGAGGGYGLKSIIAVCRRHGGEYLPQWTENEYTARFFLNL
jgi:sensor histidine kinase regulating citrate/malate metabolism